MFTINSGIIRYFEKTLDNLYWDMKDVQELCVLDYYRPIITYPVENCIVFNEKWIHDFQSFYHDIDVGDYSKTRINGKEVFGAPIKVKGRLEAVIAIAGDCISDKSCNIIKEISPKIQGFYK